VVVLFTSEKRESGHSEPVSSSESSIRAALDGAEELNIVGPIINKANLGPSCQSVSGYRCPLSAANLQVHYEETRRYLHLTQMYTHGKKSRYSSWKDSTDNKSQISASELCKETIPKALPVSLV